MTVSNGLTVRNMAVGRGGQNSLLFYVSPDFASRSSGCEQASGVGGDTIGDVEVGKEEWWYNDVREVSQKIVHVWSNGSKEDGVVHGHPGRVAILSLPRWDTHHKG